MITPIKVKGPDMNSVYRSAGIGQRIMDKIIWGEKRAKEIEEWTTQQARDKETKGKFWLD